MRTPSENEAPLIKYYETRDTRRLSVTEFGHNIYPICLTASALDRPYRRYTGIETWYRGGEAARKQLQDRISAISGSDTLNETTRFITHDSGITIKRDGDERWQVGSYTPYTTSDKGHEDEVVASNLFGDPDIAESTLLTQAILAQMAQMTRSSGLIVLRETITPERVRPFSKALLGEVGLKGHMTYRAINSPFWKKLESIYDGGKAQPLSPESLYIFLQRESSTHEDKIGSAQNSSQ